jgi:hypothetical protein
VAVAELHVLFADVLGAPVPVVVRVVRLGRHEAAEQRVKSSRKPFSNSFTRTDAVVCGE